MSFWKKVGKFAADVAVDTGKEIIKSKTGGRVDLTTDSGQRKFREDLDERKREREENRDR